MYCKKHFCQKNCLIIVPARDAKHFARKEHLANVVYNPRIKGIDSIQRYKKHLKQSCAEYYFFHKFLKKKWKNENN